MNDLPKQLGIALAAIAFFLFSAYAITHGATDYKIGRYVNDYANVLTYNEVRELEHRMAGTNTVILTVPDLGGESIEDFSIRHAKAARIGDSTNNGALVTMALAERKLRIEVGYGKEGDTTDTKSYEIIQRAKPFLAKGHEQWAKAFTTIVEGLK